MKFAAYRPAVVDHVAPLAAVALAGSLLLSACASATGHVSGPAAASSARIRVGTNDGGLPVSFEVPVGWRPWGDAWAVNTRDGAPTFMTLEFLPTRDDGHHEVITVCVELRGEPSCPISGQNLIQVDHGARETATISVMPASPPLNNTADRRVWHAVDVSVS